MATKPTQLRIPPELLSQIDHHAKERGMTRTALILEAVGRHLEPEIVSEIHRHSAAQVKQAAALMSPSPKVVIGTTAEPVFRCREEGCDWVEYRDTASPRCERHGYGGPIRV